MTFTLHPLLGFPLEYRRPEWCGRPVTPDGSKIALSTSPEALTILESGRLKPPPTIPPETHKIA